MSRRLALIIGNSRYDDPGLASLGAPDVDVRELGEALRSSDVGQFDHVVQLLDETSPAVRRAIAQLFHLKRRDDLVLLYFSGHGIRDDQGALHLATRDTERSLLSATGIEASFITSQMDRSASRRQVLILDCCHSGAFGGKNAVGTSIGTASAFEGIGFGRVVLTATDATQYAWEGDRVVGEAEPSLFTKFLVLGIQSGAADLNGDGEITIDELYEFAYDEVVNSTSKQIPGKWAFKQQGEIVIARNPRGVHAAVLPPALVEKIASPVPGVRLQAIRDLAVILRGQHRARSMAARAALEKLENDDAPAVAEAAHSILAMHPAEGRRTAVTDRPTEAAVVDPRQEAAARRFARHLSGRLVRVSALVLAVLAVIFFGARGIWNAGRDDSAEPAISRPAQNGPATVPTTGTRPTDGGGAATDAGSKLQENTDGPGKDTPATGRADSQNAGAMLPQTDTARPGALPRGGKSSNAKGRASSSTSSPVTATSSEKPATAPEVREPAASEAGSPPVRPQADLTAQDRKEILDVLDRYRQAYNRKDMTAIKQFYPSASRNLFGKGERDCSAFDLRFVVEPKVVFFSADTAQVNTISVYVCIPKSKSTPPGTPPVQDRFEFVKRDGVWVIQEHFVPRAS